MVIPLVSIDSFLTEMGNRKTATTPTIDVVFLFVCFDATPVILLPLGIGDVRLCQGTVWVCYPTSLANSQ